MVAVLLFYLVGVFVGQTSSGVVPKNFKSIDNEHSDFEAVFNHNDTNATNPTFEHSDLHNELSSGLVEFENLNASHVAITELHNISDSDHAIPEESHAVKKISTGSGRSKKKNSKESKKKNQQVSNKTFHEASDHHADTNLKSDTSIGDHFASVGDHSTSVGDHSASVGDHSASVGDHSASIGDHSATITNHSDSIINHSSSIEDHSVSVGDHSASVGDHSASVGDHSATIGDHSATIRNHSDSIVNHSSSIRDHSSSVGDHSASVEDHSASVEDHSSSVEDHSASVGNNSASVDDNSSFVADHFSSAGGHSSTNGNHSASIGDHSASIGDHSEDVHQSDNNVSERLDHTEHITDNNLDNISDHSEDLTIESDPLNSVSESFDRDVNVVNKEFNISVLDNKNHLEKTASDLNHFNPDHLNDSVIDFNIPLKKVIENVSKELNSTLNKTISELDNSTTADAPKTSEEQTGHLEHVNNSHNTVQLNQAAPSLASKLFLNIHNSFMNLNPTDKTDSSSLNHIDKTSSEIATNMHDRLDKTKIDEEILKKSSETGVNSEDINSSEIKTHDTNAGILVPVAANDGDENISAEHPDEVHGDLTKSELFNGDIKNPIVTKTNETQGLFSTLGLDFLMNSELAKNAASAMEVFNFSDSALTDHIVDGKNDMHDFLDLMPLEHKDNQTISNHTPTASSILDAESSSLDTESSTIEDTESSTIEYAESSKLDEESSTLDVESSKVDAESSSSSENGIFEVFNTTPSQPLLNSTVEYEVTTIPSQLLLNSSVEYEDTTTISPPMLRNNTKDASVAKCPPPGFCIFWFLGQDTCTVNSHCLGSRICCRMGCAKTCIEV